MPKEYTNDSNHKSAQEDNTLDNDPHLTCETETIDLLDVTDKWPAAPQTHSKIVCL